MGFWRAYVTCIQFPEVGLQRARPKRRVRGGDVRAKNDLRDDVMDVPGMKLFQIFIIGLKKKYNDEKALCWSDFIFFLTSNSVTTSFNLSKFFSAGLINEKKKREKIQTN